MQIRTVHRTGVLVFHLEGDFTEVDELVAQVAPTLDSPGSRVVIDLKKVGMITSTGLGALVRLAAQANMQRSKLALAEPSPFVSSVLSTSKLDKFFEVYPTIEAALAKV